MALTDSKTAEKSLGSRHCSGCGYFISGVFWLCLWQELTSSGRTGLLSTSTEEIVGVRVC